MDTSTTTIFVADDNQALLQGLDRALSSSGYTVRTAGSGDALFELLEHAPNLPDLLLLDVMMPGMTGFDILERVRSDPRWADLPVMLVTAASDETLPVSALQGGAADFLTKPFRLAELLARVEAHLQRARALRRARLDARASMRASDVVRDLNAAVTASEMFELVTSRAAEIWAVARCSIVLCDEDESVGRVVASSEAAEANGMVLALERYPEIRAVLETGEPVLIEDVATSPLFRELRTEWQRLRIKPPLRSVLAVPLYLSDATRGVLMIRSTAAEPALGHEALTSAVQIVEAMIHALGRAHIFETLVEQRMRLDALAHTDELTGASTRRSVLRHLEDELFLARRHEQPLSVVMLDLDGFKAINDSDGHLAGDAVLRALGEWFRGEGSLRGRDCAGRYGGDEFLVVLPETGEEGAVRFAERARDFLTSVPFAFGGEVVRASLSAGTATWLPGEPEPASPEALIERADAALYRAKNAGRDTIHPARPPRSSAG
jgi:two-component system cell cycle response regulator